MLISGQRVVILGGSSGVGLATAQLLANAGAMVVITGRDEQKLAEAASLIGGGAQAEAVDASNAAVLQDFFARIGQFDHLVITLSGASGGGMFRDLDLSTVRRGFEAKFWLHITAAQMALKTLRNDGSITFVSAISARTANPGTAGLAAINGAIESMVPTLAVELKPLRVNAVSPGVIDTPWWNRVPVEQRQALFEDSANATPVGRIGKPEDVAEAIASLVQNTFMTGAVVECDGGLRLT